MSQNQLIGQIFIGKCEGDHIILLDTCITRSSRVKMGTDVSGAIFWLLMNTTLESGS